MPLVVAHRGGLTTWISRIGTPEIVAGPAHLIRDFLENKAPRWRAFGSPDQPNRIFVAADHHIDLQTLDDLWIGDEYLLPEGSSWNEIGHSGIDFFSDEPRPSSHVERRQPHLYAVGKD